MNDELTISFKLLWRDGCLSDAGCIIILQRASQCPDDGSLETSCPESTILCPACVTSYCDIGVNTVIGKRPIVSDNFFLNFRTHKMIFLVRTVTQKCVMESLPRRAHTVKQSLGHM